MDTNKDILISVIIPVYNTGKYVKTCLKSITDQTYKNLEIIVVNGDSTDDTGRICDEIAKEDPRIIVIHKENNGVNSDRKAGLKRANGEYIGFIDGDDWMEPEMYESLLDKAERFGADIVCSGLRYRGTKENSTLFDAIPEGCYEDKDYLSDNMVYFKDTDKWGILPGINHKLFRKEVIYQNYLCLEDMAINSEDMALTVAAVLDSKRVYVLHESYYNYRYHEGSMTTTPDPRYFERINRMLLYVKNKLDHSPHTKELEKKLDVYADLMFMVGLDKKYKYYHEGSIPVYVFPPGVFPKSSRLVLYGAGYYGSSYHKQFQKRNGYELVLWVDKNASRYGDEVKEVEELKRVEFDFIVIAVQNPGTAEEIMKELKEMGIPEKKLLWRKPIHIMECI